MKESLRKDIEDVIKATFDDMLKIYKLQTTGEGVPESKLRFPYKYKNYERGKLRISEQELRSLFVEKLQNKGLYYNIEAPTMGDYRFENTEGKVRSGNFDLVICDETGKERSALIEFKGLNPDKKCYAKDYWKLQNSQEQGVLRYFLQVVKSANDNTYENIAKKKDSIKEFAQNKTFNVDINDLKEQVIYRCVSLDDSKEITDEIHLPNHP